ncbi:hypothetical protein SH2C18_49900 [Clostridium sediminicola]|uniref:PAS domain-containing sensor histidine kinase n=1 Tax=Clostridium sediminicola TaxID=3114879 RepID=UPI0031F1F8D6
MLADNELKLEEYEFLLDSLDTQLWTLHDTDTYGFVNKAHAEFLGLEKEDIEHKKIKIVLSNVEAYICVESTMMVWREKKQIITKEWITNAKGNPCLLHITKIPIFDKNKNIMYVLCKAYDITDDEEMKNKFSISSKQYSSIVENHSDLICRILPDGTLTFVNQTYCKYFDKTSSELLGTNILTLIPEDEHECLIQHLSSFNIHNPIRVLEHHTINSNGQINWQIWKDEAFFDNEGKIIEIQSIGKDITDLKETQKKLNEVLEYDKLKTEFFANISHELRTPLNVILSTLQLLEYRIKIDTIGLAKEDKYLKITKQNCFRLLRLINNLIDITKIDSGYFSVNMKNYNIVHIIEEITLSVVEYIENKNITLLFDTDTEEKIMACDPDQLERIILNLLSNAVKFTEPGGSIIVTVCDKGEYILISVKDTGIGIPQNKLDIIFQRFRQIDKSFSRTHEGSGIGLSLTKSIVKMLGGEINARSEENKGSEFIIKLPAKLIDDKDSIIDNMCVKNNYVDSINIEFSDIYSV